MTPEVKKMLLDMADTMEKHQIRIDLACDCCGEASLSIHQGEEAYVACFENSYLLADEIRYVAENGSV